MGPPFRSSFRVVHNPTAEGNLWQYRQAQHSQLKPRCPVDVTDSRLTTTEPPSELAGPLPRRVTPDFAGDARFLVPMALLLFFGGGLLLGRLCLGDIEQFRQRAELRSDGRVVAGTVTEPTRGYTNYRFSIQGRLYLGRAGEPLFNPWIVHPSEQILIRYLPSNPNINHPDSWEWSVYVGLESIVLTAFFWMIGVVVLVALWRERTLARNGIVAAGRVKGCHRKDRLFQVDYEFFTEYGVGVQGHTSRVDEFEAGSRVWILYLPQRPSRNAIYPLSLFDIDA